MTEMPRKEIFTFWEPKGKIHPYLELCKKTWEKNLPDYKIITLDYSNISSYFDEKIFDWSLLKRLPLAIQKEAIMVAVLEKRGGIFMDLDTLVLNDITPLLSFLERSEVVIFNKHCAFLAAKANAYLLRLWIQGIQKKILQLKDMQITNDVVKWDYLGTSVLTETMAEITGKLEYDARLIALIIDKFILLYKKFAGKSLWLIELADRFKNAHLNRRRDFVFSTVYRKYLKILDRRKYGFIREALYYRTRKMDPVTKYLNFWFKSGLTVDAVLGNDQMLIGLHNSWTPEWYKVLSGKEVLEHECLLSKTLKHALL